MTEVDPVEALAIYRSVKAQIQRVAERKACDAMIASIEDFGFGSDEWVEIRDLMLVERDRRYPEVP